MKYPNAKVKPEPVRTTRLLIRRKTCHNGVIGFTSLSDTLIVSIVGAAVAWPGVSSGFLLRGGAATGGVFSKSAFSACVVRVP